MFLYQSHYMTFLASCCIWNVVPISYCLYTQFVGEDTLPLIEASDNRTLLPSIMDSSPSRSTKKGHLLRHP